MTVRRVRKKCVFSNSGISETLKVISIIGLLALVFLTLGCENKKSPKPLSLGHFTKISNLSISPDGNQLLFTGSGHREYRDTTIYRYEINNARLYRYLPRGSNEILHGGRFAPCSSRFVFAVIPYDTKNRNLYEDMQMAMVNQDGSDFRIITQSKGVKLHPAISYDEKNLVFFKGRMSDSGSPLRKQRTKATGFDLFKLDLATGKETQLTRLEFYGVGAPYFTSDDKYVVFDGKSPLRLPHTDNIDAVKQFRDAYTKKYKENIILQYPLDGSGIYQEPVPMFSFDGATKNSIVTKDGSVWFEGQIGFEHFIHYYRKTPYGIFLELSDKDLGQRKEGNALIVLFEMVATPDGSRLVILNVNQDTDQHFIRILDTKSHKHYDLTIPATAENISIR